MDGSELFGAVKEICEADIVNRQFTGVICVGYRDRVLFDG